MSSLCYIFLIWLSCVGSFMADSRLVSARVGSTAVLPCEWNDPVQTPHVQWNTDTEIVFERKGEKLFQGKGYENRVDVPEDKLLEGNCSLVLKNVSVTDAGFYQSHLSVKRIKRASSTKWILVQTLELRVDETAVETVQNTPDARETHVYERLMVDGGVNCLRPQITPLSLLTSLCVFMCFR